MDMEANVSFLMLYERLVAREENPLKSADSFLK